MRRRSDEDVSKKLKKYDNRKDEDMLKGGKRKEGEKEEVAKTRERQYPLTTTYGEILP